MKVLLTEGNCPRKRIKKSGNVMQYPMDSYVCGINM